MIEYRSAFSGYLQDRENRSWNAPEGEEGAYAVAAINAFGNFYEALPGVDVDEDRKRLNNSLKEFESNRNSASAVQLVQSISKIMSRQKLADFSGGTQMQIRKGVLSLIEFASLRRSEELAVALKSLSPIFE